MSNVVRKILIFAVCLRITASSLSQSLMSFTECNVGKQINYKNQAGHVKILVCAGVKDGVRLWQYTDGSSTLGEIFNPAKDCPDIVDHLPGAEDGFYWISLDNITKYKLWCDVHTDGGGFTLVGMKDSPVSWTVPSNTIPVDPQGPPHWSSKLGDLKVLDFRVQFAQAKSFEGTKADWFYRLKQKRQLGNLFTNDVALDCTKDDPGIGDIKYVKDVLTASVSTTNFECSIFGPHTHPSLGWGRMNHCLRNDCKNGYGVFPGPVPFPYAQYGSFSYSGVEVSSGTERNSTAFVGCDGGKCCACFGPKGGRQNYCGPKCTAFNGGTLMKKVYVWFWVRTRMPDRLWKKCMEFMVNNSVGRLEKYFVDPRTGTAHKGSCSEQFRTLINEGTLTVSDKESFEKIPDIPGLLSYRADNKQLYVNQGSKWQALGNEQEIKKLQEKVNSQEAITKSQGATIKSQGATIKSQGATIKSQGATIKSQGAIIKSQGATIKSQGATIISQQNDIKDLKKTVQDIVNITNWYHPIRTCSVLQERRNLASSGIYTIYPQGFSSPVHVNCDMTSKNGVGVTEIGHDSESRTFVNGYELPRSYKRPIKYHLPMQQIVAIINQSQHCEQFIKYECYHSGLFKFDHDLRGTWVSRQGSEMNYWGGATLHSLKCACGVTSTCAGGGKCNCDINDNTWREDSGYLRDKNTLPVTELKFGDTGDSNELGYRTLSKLRCWD